MASWPGRGSRFSFGLAGIDLPEKAALRPAAPRDAVGRALRVLVVDNDARIVEATTALLAGLGHRPVGVTNVANALAVCAQVDAVLADYQLDDGEEGLSLIEAIWQHRPGLPVRLITAESGEGMKARAQQLGVTILAKPVDPGAIQRFLAEVSVLDVKPE